MHLCAFVRLAERKARCRSQMMANEARRDTEGNYSKRIRKIRIKVKSATKKCRDKKRSDKAETRERERERERERNRDT